MGYDFGPEKSVSPIDVVMEHGGAADAVQAALWLCDQLGVDPADLGWKEKATKEQKKRQPKTKSSDKVSDHPKADRLLNIGSDVEIAGRVVQDLVGRFGEVVSCDGAFWRYTGTHWEAIADEVLWLAVHAYDGARFVTAKGEPSPVKLSRSRIDFHPGLHEAQHRPARLLRRGARSASTARPASSGSMIKAPRRWSRTVGTTGSVMSWPAAGLFRRALIRNGSPC